MASNKKDNDIEEDENANNINNNLNNRTILLLDRTFFKIIRTESEHVQGECTTCKRTIKGRIGSTTNFLNHLKVNFYNSIINYYNYYICLVNIIVYRFRLINVYIDNTKCLLICGSISY